MEESKEVKTLSKQHIKETLKNALKRARGIRATGVSKLNVPQILNIILEYVKASQEALSRSIKHDRPAGELIS
jgi:hypothetical protein